eukprot:522700-Prymnesium_polylepis.1
MAADSGKSATLVAVRPPARSPAPHRPVIRAGAHTTRHHGNPLKVRANEGHPPSKEGREVVNFGAPSKRGRVTQPPFHSRWLDPSAPQLLLRNAIVVQERGRRPCLVVEHAPIGEQGEVKRLEAVHGEPELVIQVEKPLASLRGCGKVHLHELPLLAVRLSIPIIASGVPAIPPLFRQNGRTGFSSSSASSGRARLAWAYDLALSLRGMHPSSAENTTFAALRRRSASRRARTSRRFVVTSWSASASMIVEPGGNDSRHRRIYCRKVYIRAMK